MPNKKTNEEFQKTIFKLVKNDYKFNEPYVNMKTKINVTHDLCSYSYNVTPDEFIHGGNRCPKCVRDRLTKQQTKPHEKFVKEVFELVESNYTVLSKYTHNKVKVKIKHNTCNHEYDVKPYAFLHGNSRCPKCFGTPKKTTEEFKQEVFNLVGEEYTVLGKYFGNKKNIKIKHNVCNYIWNVVPAHFLNTGTRCPECARYKSKGELKIIKYLTENNINYINNKPHEKLNSHLFDFQFQNRNLIIEYDGIQHHQPITLFGGEKQFEIQKQKDQEKNDFCKLNGINLIRIPYWDYDKLDEILEKMFNDYPVKE